GATGGGSSCATAAFASAGSPSRAVPGGVRAAVWARVRGAGSAPVRGAGSGRAGQLRGRRRTSRLPGLVGGPRAAPGRTRCGTAGVDVRQAAQAGPVLDAGAAAPAEP